MDAAIELAELSEQAARLMRGHYALPALEARIEALGRSCDPRRLAEVGEVDTARFQVVCARPPTPQVLSVLRYELRGPGFAWERELARTPAVIERGLRKADALGLVARLTEPPYHAPSQERIARRDLEVIEDRAATVLAQLRWTVPAPHRWSIPQPEANEDWPTRGLAQQRSALHEDRGFFDRYTTDARAPVREVLELEAGDPGLVVLVANEASLSVAVFALGWTGPHTLEARHRPVQRWAWASLPSDPVARTDLVIPAVEEAVRQRRATFSVCSLCRRSLPPEWMGGDACHSCQERHRHIVH